MFDLHSAIISSLGASAFCIILASNVSSPRALKYLKKFVKSALLKSLREHTSNFLSLRLL